VNITEAKKILKSLSCGRYHCITYTLNEHKNGDLSQECTLYITNEEIITAPTWEDAIRDMKLSMAGRLSVKCESIEEINDGK
jgi:hypothetical protein